MTVNIARTAIMATTFYVASSGLVPVVALDLDGENLWEGAKAELALRYRFAFIDQAGFDRNAKASTLQTLFGVRTGNVGGFYGYLQFRNVARIGSNSYNSTLNGRTEFPVEADPTDTDYQQAYIGYQGIKNTNITFGRRQLAWGDQRFISSLPWRQNQNSFDGLTVESDLGDGFSIKYAYAFNVNRAFTDRSAVGKFDSNIHLANLSYQWEGVGTATAYGYFLDMNDDFAQPLSTNTYGLNFKGAQDIGEAKLGYILEYASQEDRGANPFEIDTSYKRFEPSLIYKGFKTRIGYEELSGDGVRGFQTPLALLHAFNGFADVFVNTPAAGLRDRYAEVKYAFPKDTALAGLGVTVAYHHFESDEGGQKYGTEWNAAVSKKLFGRVSALAKIAVYDADGFATDRTKFWLVLSSKF